MNINFVTNFNNNTNFKAKFFQSEDLKEIVRYAESKGKIDKLLAAKNNISKNFMTTRILVETGYNEKLYPVVTFSKFIPKPTVVVPKSNEDFLFIRSKTYVANKIQNVYEFALEKIIKMGNNVPANKIYRNVVMSTKRQKVSP